VLFSSWGRRSVAPASIVYSSGGAGRKAACFEAGIVVDELLQPLSALCVPGIHAVTLAKSRLEEAFGVEQQHGMAAYRAEHPPPNFEATLREEIRRHLEATLTCGLNQM
jgi:hypothetical protein